jgi:Uma2 family endonuclease
LTVRDYEELPEDPANRLELRAGLLIREPPPGMLHSRVQGRLVHRLWAHVEPRRLGAVLVDAGFILAVDPATIRIPDLAFVKRDRIPASGYGSGMWQMAPDLAIEILSPSNRPRAMEEKLADYKSAGTGEVWLIDAEAKTVTIHHARDRVRVLESKGMLRSDLIPGFEISLLDLFAP